jgi:hypothetical protein
VRLPHHYEENLQIESITSEVIRKLREADIVDSEVGRMR